jgi:hypothetical protein
MRLLVALLLLPATSVASSQDWTPSACSASLERAYSFFAARSEAATQGDFNGDGALDFALLLVAKAPPNKPAIGVCLSKEARPLLITSPYQSAKIFTKPKGTQYMDFENEKPGTYELDAISVSDGAWLGASYILRGGVFVQLVDSD